MPNRSISWNSPVVVFTVVFCLVLGTATLVTRALYANGSNTKSRAKVASGPTFVSTWRDIAAVGQAQGSRNAAVTVVVFADYQCPGCAELHKLLRMAVDSLGDSLRVVSRHFPLSSHVHATAAANAAECAAEQGRFREFEHVVYGRQDSIGIRSWPAFAVDAGVRDARDFAQCVNTRRHSAAVERDLRVARELKLEGTPVYLVNGTSHFGAPPLRELMAQLRASSDSTIAAVPVENRAPLEGNRVDNAASAGSARRWSTPLVLEHTITGPTQDELLVPSGLAATADGRLVVFDFGSMEVRSFNAAGHQLWRVGRKGAGPGEFRNAMDVKVRGNGAIAVLDMGNRRITTISANGRVLRTAPLRMSAHRFIPLPDTTFFALAGDDSSALWTGVNARGDSIRRTPAPPELVAHQGIEREVFSAPLSDGAVVAFRWSAVIALLEADGSVRRLINGIEPVAFPGVKSYPLKSGKFSGAVHRVSPAAIPAALSVTATHDEVMVLFAGATQHRGRIVDVYDRMSGTYLRSHLLPFPVVELVALPDNGFATLRGDPVPSIDIWRASGARAK